MIYSQSQETARKSPEKPAKKHNKHRPTYAGVLERNLRKICKDFEEIFEQHELLKKSVPAEYAYHLNKLTNCIVEAVEDGRIRGYSGNQLKQLGRNFFKSDYQRIVDASQEPLIRFKKEYLPQAIECLEYYKSAAKGTELDKEVDAVLVNLKDLKKNLASIR